MTRLKILERVLEQDNLQFLKIFLEITIFYLSVDCNNLC